MLKKSDLITSSIEKVNRDFYVHYEDGSLVHQISSSKIIEQTIRMLDPSQGERILEIGTGSGYNTAILSHIVGHGTVISVDIDPDMVERASKILQQDERNNVRVFLGNGKNGLLEKAPYDKIIAWASAEHKVPPAIVEQLASSGIIVCPLRDGNNSYIASFTKTATGNLKETTRISGGFIPLTDRPFHPWLNS